MNGRQTVCVLALFLAGSFSTAPCQGQVGEKYALLVGVREYDKNELRTLPFSEADVEGLARLLRDSGYRAENVVVMTQSIGSKQPRYFPIATNIRKELDLLLAGRDEADSIVIALAGHGVQFRDDDECYFCPTDAKLGEKETLIPLGQIYRSLEASKANLKLLLVDACRNDPQADNSRSRAQVKLDSVTRPQTKDPPGGVAALFSCSAGERAFEHAALKRGVFFHFVIQGLGGEADFDRDRIVTLPELQQYTMKRVPDFVRAEYGVVQTPDLRGRTRGLFPLLKIDPAANTTSQTRPRLAGQSVASRQIVQKFVEILEKSHISERKFDDEVAARTLDNLLEAFDFQKNFFLQSDVDRFRAQAGEIDDKARVGDLGIVWDVFQLWVDRRIERRKWVDEWLETTHDFSSPEEFTIVPGAWPRTPDEAKDEWRKRVKFQILTSRAHGYDWGEATHQASRALNIQFFGNLRSFDDDGMLETGLNSLGQAFDPLASYYSAKSLANVRITFEQRLEGIGVELRTDERGPIVSRILPTGPAARDGRLKIDDRIIGIGEKQGPLQPVADLKFVDAVAMIRGAGGTVVRLQVVPHGTEQPVVYELTRGGIDLVQPARATTFTESRRDDSRPVQVGLITVPTLYSDSAVGGKTNEGGAGRSSAGDVARILTRFNRENVDVAVLDLRYNPGGVLTEALAVLGLFLDPGPGLLTRQRGSDVRAEWTNEKHLVWDRPLIVLTSRQTGPGAAIIAGTLKDYRRAIVVGDDPTGGNSSSREIVDIGRKLVSGSNPPNLGAVTVTTVALNLPSGRPLVGASPLPDIHLPWFPDAAAAESRHFPWKVAPVAPVVVPVSQFVSPRIVERLQRVAAERQAVAPDFLEYIEQMRTYRRQKDRNTMPIDEPRFLAISNSDVHFPPPEKGAPPVVSRDAYVNEVLAIAVDFAPRGRWTEHFTAGMAALRRSAHADAVVHFTAAINEDSDQPATYMYRARAYAGQGHWDQALADAKRAEAESVSAYARAAADVKVGDKVVAPLTSGQRVVVQKVNGDWLWVRPITNAGPEGWVQKSSLLPFLPEASKWN